MTDDREHRPLRVLFVCTGNSARSLLGEALLRHHGGDHFEVFSAGTHPAGVNPLTIRVLTEAGLPTDGLRSKSVTEFLDQSFDYVITVCDDARQVCPVFPGVHESLHWGSDDPAAVGGDEATRLAAFRRTATAMGERVKQFATLVHRVSPAAADRA
ncbi:MAG: arsenate reductase ArsC [Chloroflexi bacterium]|nr:arsenate reductase ArsC [Chloroflexota bacterium]